MVTTQRKLRLISLVLLSVTIGCATLAIADDVDTFATGGYAEGLRTPEMMQAIDTDHDGSVSREEWIAFQEKMFSTLDSNHSGRLDRKQFMRPNREAVAFATAAYVRGMQTDEMFDKIDTNHDGTISHDEYIKYQGKIFDMMDRGGKRSLGPTDWIRKSG